jgi:hypothetical protein
MNPGPIVPRRAALVGLSGWLLLGPGPGPARPDDPPLDGYEPRRIEGWMVVVDRGFLGRSPGLADRTLTLLGAQLDRVARRLPAGAVEKLRAVRIWVEEAEPHHPCMAYHPHAGWLRDHGMSPEKARSVEIANARNFLGWTEQQPWMVLHELAHAYHHQILPDGFENAEVTAAFDRAMRAGLYDSVARVGGRTERAYAASNPREYFAESSEALFGTNDFFPFHRAELERHDPGAAALLARLWGEPRPAP